ncbi:hypothetical protein CcCBS67573_g10349 [Chytriomyces confervae]|uniref:DDE Tnp4 domain-containing protein n=1 Tax=Chytriomyces confervae TaxID=246404 RepID=A0A507D3F7_9FUNG|nr:hypothetical protein CcCBS67573_g10349 [Chytriomyces confervae]
MLVGKDLRMMDAFWHMLCQQDSRPDRRWYLGDVGYSLTNQVLVPYRGTHYHLKEWGQANERCYFI